MPINMTTVRDILMTCPEFPRLLYLKALEIARSNPPDPAPGPEPLHILVQGMCEPNPGPMKFVFAATQGERPLVGETFQGGNGTCNWAAYLSVMTALDFVWHLWPDSRLIICTDSQLVDKQINSNWRSAVMKPYRQCLRSAKKTSGFELRWLKREELETKRLTAFRDLIQSAYQKDEVWNDAPSLRAGSIHEEDPRNGDAHCIVCGRIQKGTANPVFHPETYL